MEENVTEGTASGAAGDATGHTGGSGDGGASNAGSAASAGSASSHGGASSAGNASSAGSASSHGGAPATVVLCHCGRLMADLVDVSALARRAGPDPRAAALIEQRYACFGSGLASIVEAARSGPVLVAACGPEMHGATLARALTAAGLPADRARLIDVRAEGFACRARARATAAAEALVADALSELEVTAEPAVPSPHVTLVGGGPAADEAAALLEAGGLAVHWLDDAIEAADPGVPAVTRIGRISAGFRIERDGSEPVESGAIILAFSPLDADAAALAPAFLPGPQVLTLGQAEGFLLDEPAPEDRGAASALPGAAASASAPALPADEPEVIALITGCVAGLPRPSAPGVNLGRVLDLAFALRARYPRSRQVLFYHDTTGAPRELESLLRSFRRDHGVTVRGSVHRGVFSGGAIHVHATDADLAKRVMLAADLCIVDPGQIADPRAAAWCALLGIPDAAELSSGSVFTRIPGVLVASSSEPLSASDAALRGAACAAHCLARLRGRS